MMMEYSVCTDMYDDDIKLDQNNHAQLKGTKLKNDREKTPHTIIGTGRDGKNTSAHLKPV